MIQGLLFCFVLVVGVAQSAFAIKKYSMSKAMEVLNEPYIRQFGQGAAKSDEYFFDETLKAYEEGFVAAVNTGKFERVADSLVAGSPFYDQQKRLIKRLFTQGVKEKLLDYDLQAIRINEKKNEACLSVREKIEITSPPKEGQVKTFQWSYTLIFDGQRLRILAISSEDEKTGADKDSPARKKSKAVRTVPLQPKNPPTPATTK